MIFIGVSQFDSSYSRFSFQIRSFFFHSPRAHWDIWSNEKLIWTKNFFFIPQFITFYFLSALCENSSNIHIVPNFFWTYNKLVYIITHDHKIVDKLIFCHIYTCSIANSVHWTHEHNSFISKTTQWCQRGWRLGCVCVCVCASHRMNELESKWFFLQWHYSSCHLFPSKKMSELTNSVANK